MKKTAGLFFIFMLLTSFLFSGELYVNQMGYGWLVQDDYVDALYNPAMLSYVKGNTLTFRLDNDITSKSSDYSYSSSYRYFSLGITPSLIYYGNFGDFSGAISSRTHYDDSRNLQEGIHGTAAYKANENLRFGLNAYIDYYYVDKELSSFQGAGLGADYEKDGIDLGTAVFVSSAFAENEDYVANINIMAGWKPDAKILLRFINSATFNSYEQFFDKSLVPDELKHKFFGSKNMVNNTGISLESENSGVKYALSLYHNWVIFGYSDHFSGDLLYAESGEHKTIQSHLNINLGFESKVFTDWLLLRVNYAPFVFDYNSESFNDESYNLGVPDYFARVVKTYEVKFMRNSSISIGAEAKMGNSYTLDVSVNTGGFFDRYYQEVNHGIAAYPKSTTLNNAANFSLELTYKF